MPGTIVQPSKGKVEINFGYLCHDHPMLCANESRFVISAAIKKGAEAALQVIIDEWPVDTALSIAGFRVHAVNDSWAIRNNVEYTAYVHNDLIARVMKSRGWSAASNAFKQELARIHGVRNRRTSVAPYGATEKDKHKTGIPVRSLDVVRLTATVQARRAASKLGADLLKQGILTKWQYLLVKRGRYKVVIKQLRKAGRAKEADRLDNITGTTKGI